MPMDYVQAMAEKTLNRQGGPADGFDHLDSTDFRTGRHDDAALLRLFESLRKNLAENSDDLFNRASLRFLVCLFDHGARSPGVVLEAPEPDTG